MGSGYKYSFGFGGSSWVPSWGAYKNQEQHDNARHILDTNSTDAKPLTVDWAKELVKILTNGKMTVDYHFSLVSSVKLKPMHTVSFD